MTEETPLKKILKKRKITLGDLYFKINKEIDLVKLSDIRIGRKIPSKEEIKILNNYLDLTDEEIEYLENMEIDEILLENAKKINNLMALVPRELKAGESIERICPNCNSKLTISRAKINGHLWIVCDKEGVLICQ